MGGITVKCPECGYEYEIEPGPETTATCPECSFGPDKCNHPVSERDSHQVYSVDEGKYVEYVYCGKCGTSVTDF